MIADFPGYVFGRSFWWLLGALVLGALIGYFLNGWRKRTWVETTTATTSTAAFASGGADAAAPSRGEARAARAAAAEHEQVVAERDRLRKLVDEHQSTVVDHETAVAGLRAQLDEAASTARAATDRADRMARNHDGVLAERDRYRDLIDSTQNAHEKLVAERDQLREVIAKQRATVDIQAEKLADCEATVAALRAGDDTGAHSFGVHHLATTPAPEPHAESDQQPAAAPVLDLGAAAQVLGGKIKLDDLKVVEGIGPKIEELLHGGGITTWAGLAASPVDRLREILDAAGERFRIHNPGSWPRQAELLATGQWAEFKRLTDELTAGRE